VDDSVSWCLLALVIAIVNASTLLNALYVFLMVTAFAAFMFLLMRPALAWLNARVNNGSQTSQLMMAITFVLVKGICAR
jgi:Kef-type K+ transport system membrane component KefB